MNTRPRWTYEATDGPAPELWAPHVIQTASDIPEREQFTMYVAPAATPLVCPPAGYSEAIDPSVDTTRNGNRYLIYKIGNYTPRRFKIMALRVDDVTGTTKQGTPKVVLNADQIGSAVAEAPDVYRAPNGRVHLFVSRNGYRDCD